MFKPVKLIVKNFGPIKSATIDFTNSENVIVVLGENKTDEGQESNGSGKSYIMEAINYSVTGSSFRKAIDSELVMDDEKCAELYFELESKTVNENIQIERCIYSNTKSSTISIYLNNEEQKQLTSVNEANKFILDRIGISREDIVKYFFISKETYKSFFSITDKEKKELIGRFSKANLIDDVIPNIEDDKKEITDKIIKLEKDILKLEARIETLREEDSEEELEKAKARNDERILDIESKLPEMETKLEEMKSENLEMVKAIKQSEQQLKKIEPETVKKKIDKQKISLSSINQEIKSLRDSNKETNEILAEIEKGLLGIIQCPNCNHEFNAGNPDFDIPEGRETKLELDEIIKELDSEIAEKNLSISDIEKTIREYNDEYNLLLNKQQTIKRNINSYQSVIDRNNKESEDINKRTETLLLEVQELYSKKFESKNSEKIKDSQKQLKNLEKQIIEQSEKERFYDEWVLNFTSFKNYLSNKSLKSITQYTNLYLQKLGSSLQVNFEGYKEVNRGKKRKEQIGIKILKFGQNKGNFGRLSGGEKTRVEMAVILALSEIINVSTQGRGLNLIILDEILESLDGLGLTNTVKAMSNVSQQVMMITQMELRSKEGYTQLKVVKENDVSKLI